MERIYKKQRLDHFWAIVCPDCGEILASASEKDFLPEFAYCECRNKDQNNN